MIRAGRRYRYRKVAGGASVIALGVLSVDAAASDTSLDAAFTGRWRIDTASITGDAKPSVFRVGAGGFTRDDNAPVKADGQSHPIPGDGYVDEQSITIESDHVVKEIDKIRGKLAYTVAYVVSPDGNTLTSHVASYTSPSGQPVTADTLQRRVGAPVKDAHLLSGTWARVSVTSESKNDTILKLDGKRFRSRTDTGTGFDAVIGGAPVKLTVTIRASARKSPDRGPISSSKLIFRCGARSTTCFRCR
ncbi:hypothetical protein [Sphingomonas sp. UYP23]